MKTKLLIFAFLIFTIAAKTSAQSSSLWAVDFVKTKAGRQSDYLKFIDQNWRRARAYMKEKGIVAAYQVLTIPADDKAEWDVLLMTEYRDRAAYEKREAVFNEYKESVKTEGTTNAAKINSKEIAEIKFNLNFNQPISSEIGQMMLDRQTLNPESAAARLPLENYLKAHLTGDPDLMRKAFHAKSQLIFIVDGKYTTRSFADYVSTMNGKPAVDQAKHTIEFVDVTGDSAAGKIVYDYPSGRFVDYVTLLKIDNEWKIINKSFYQEPKTLAINK